MSQQSSTIRPCNAPNEQLQALLSAAVYAYMAAETPSAQKESHRWVYATRLTACQADSPWPVGAISWAQAELPA